MDAMRDGGVLMVGDLVYLGLKTKFSISLVVNDLSNSLSISMSV